MKTIRTADMHIQTGLSNTPALRLVCVAALLAMAAGSAMAQRELHMLDPLPSIFSPGGPIGGTPPPRPET